MGRRTFIFLVALTWLPAAFEVRADEPFPLDLAFNRLRPFSDVEKAAISPTGRHVAYGVLAPKTKRQDIWTLPSGLPVYYLGVRLRVVEVATGETTALGAEGSTSFAPAWSPDGSKLAYYSDEGGPLRAWVHDVAGGKSALAAGFRIKVHIYSTTAMPPAWSPDGRQLLVPALPPDEEHADPRPARGRPARQNRMGVLVLSSGDEPAPPASERVDAYSQYKSVAELTAIDLADGSTRVLLPARSTVRADAAFAQYSPSGRYLAYVSPMRPGPTPEGDDVVDLGVVRVGEAEPRFVEPIARVYEGREAYSGDFLGRSGVILAWHPTEDILLFLNDHRLRLLDCRGSGKPAADSLAPGDWGWLNGNYLAFAGGGRAVLIGLAPKDAGADSPRVEALGLVPLDGGPARKFAIPEGFDSGRIVRRDGVSLWQPVPDSATFLSPGEDGARTVVRRLDFTGGGWALVRDEPSNVEFHGMSRDGATLIGLVQGYALPPDYHRLGDDFSPRDRLGAIEPRLDGRSFGPVETFRTVVPLHDGKSKPVRTAVLLPPGAKRGDRLPAIVSVYGGSDSSLGARHYGGEDVGTIPTPVFTTRGFAVVLVDAPLGPDGRPGQPIEELRDSVLPQVYRAAELGFIDIDRVAVMGQSYGGYCTAALASSTNLFRAAVAVSGTYDLGGTYGMLRPGDNWAFWWSETGQGRMGQPPWSDLRRYVDNSPYYRADRIHTPMLILHGRDDTTCLVADAEKMFSALKRLGRPAQLAVYERQGHVVYEWEQEQAIDASERTLDFLKRHLAKSH